MTVLMGLRATIGLAIDNINIVYATFVANNEYFLDKVHYYCIYQMYQILYPMCLVSLV